MLRHDDPNSHPPDAARTRPGGFLWWYAEMLDENGSGIVLIWSFGLPFLPGLQAAARRGAPWTPSEHPSLNVSVYERGELTFYALQKYTPERVSWDGEGRWSFGDTRLQMTTSGGRRELSASLSIEPVSGPRLTGSLKLTGTVPAVGGQQLAGKEADHAWTPLALPAFATLNIDYGNGDRLCTAGRGYFDRNWSTKPLDELGIETWVWGHEHHGDHERVFYVLWKHGEKTPECVGMEYDAGGRVTVHRDLAFEAERSGNTIYGMPDFQSIELRKHGEVWAKADCKMCVDNGPFYLRYVAPGSPASGSHTSDPPVPGSFGGSLEVIVPKRIDLALHRPMVRMRVNEDGRNKPPMLSFFEGPRRGRVKRLVSTLGTRMVPWRTGGDNPAETVDVTRPTSDAWTTTELDLASGFESYDDDPAQQPERLQ